MSYWSDSNLASEKGFLMQILPLHDMLNLLSPKHLKILPLKSQYIFSLLLFVAKNRDLYESNSEIHNINTRFSSDVYTPTANLTAFQKGPYGGTVGLCWIDNCSTTHIYINIY